MTTTYLIASSILFTLCAVGASMKGRTQPDAIACALHASFATFGWICVALT
jgi:hypothetical protein